MHEQSLCVLNRIARVPFRSRNQGESTAIVIIAFGGYPVEATAVQIQSVCENYDQVL